MGDPEQDRVGSVLLGRYRIEGMLGRGGMSTVYRGMQLSVQRPVAIKLIAGSIARDAECVHRFRREAEAMARLQHPSSVRIFEFGVTALQELFIVMELLEGQDLAEHLQVCGALPLTEAVGIVHQVLEALCEAHALGVVHRDLKPANIFLAQLPRAQRLVKVMDFGIAGIEQGADDTKLTQSGVVMGTPTYLSPEQALGKTVDARSDLYSLGVTLFEMLTGKPPFVAEATAALLVAHVSTAPPRLCQLRPDVSFGAELQAFVDSLLAKRPEDRPASAELALAQLEALIAHEQLALGPYSSLRSSSAQLTSLQLSAATPLAGQRAWPVLVQGMQRTWPALAQKARRHRAGFLLGGALALGCLAWLIGAGTAEPDPHALRSEPLRAASASGLHQVRIVTSPSGASVQLNTVELGKTPYVLQFRGPTQLALELAGYEPHPLMVTPESEPNVAVELSPRSALAAVRQPGHAARETGGGTQERTAAELASEPHTALAEAEARADIPVLRADGAAPPPRTERPEPRELSVPGDEHPAVQPQAVGPQPSASNAQPAAASRGQAASAAALLAPPGRPRREALLEAGAPYANFAAARRARESGALDNAAYRDVVWALRTQRNRRIDAEKLSYRRGLITRSEYERRERQIELEYAGK